MSNDNGIIQTVLGELAFEVTDRAGSFADSLPVYGVDRGEGLTRVAKYQAKELGKYKRIQPGQLAYNPMRLNIGSIGFCGPEFSEGLVSPDYVVFSCRKDKLSPDFLKYYIKGTRWRRWTESSGVGSVRVRIYYRELAKMPVVIPPLREQQAIACILGALDDKIELNRRRNRTLEAMARAIFHSWFVDFDPVRAKAAGHKPAGLSKEIAALFPASFEDSPLGPIPKGWETRALYDTAKYINGAAFKSQDFCESSVGLPVIKIAELKDGISLQTKYSRRVADPGQLIHTGDLLYSWSGSPDTSLDAFIWTFGPGLLNQHIFKVVPLGMPQKRLVYYLLKHLRPVLVETARNKQTTGLGHVTVSDMKRIRVNWPAESIQAAFDRIVFPFFEAVFENTLANQNLAALRDALLPKLISGELRVPDAERIVGRAV